MTNKNNKNIILLLLIGTLYLYFYFLSPLFHYHHYSDYKSIDHEKIHSHLFHSKAENSNTIGHQIDIEHDDHNHPISMNAIVFVLSQRMIDVPNSSIDFFNIIGFEPENESFETNYVTDYHFGKILKDKCVHTSSNVSPPAFLTA